MVLHLRVLVITLMPAHQLPCRLTLLSMVIIHFLRFPVLLVRLRFSKFFEDGANESQP